MRLEGSVDKTWGVSANQNSEKSLLQILPNPFPSSTSLASFPHRPKPKIIIHTKKERFLFQLQLTPPNFSLGFHFFYSFTFNGCFNQLLRCKVGGFVAQMCFLQCRHHHLHHPFFTSWQKQKDTCSDSQRGHSV